MEKIYKEADKLFTSTEYVKAETLYTEFIEAVCPEMRHSTVDINYVALRGVLARYQSQLAQALNNRGQIKYLRVDFDEAVEDYNAALEVDQKFAVGFYNRGLIHYRLGRYTKGIDDFNKALALEPNFDDAKLALRTAIDESRTSNRNS